MRPVEEIRRLPVRTALPKLRAALADRGLAVLSAPPGTGKTTLVPPALAGLLNENAESAEDAHNTEGRAAGANGRSGARRSHRAPAAPTEASTPAADAAPAHRQRRVLVAEPRRMAVRAAAGRIAWLLGERVGERVGFTVRGERRVGPRTRVEVVTTGVLLHRLQRDPELPGVDCVLLDECHERHLDADLALAFLLDVRAALRPELELLAASATQDTGAWAALLGGATEPAPVVHAEGAVHPVEVRYAPPPAGVRPAHGMRVDPALLAHTAATVRRALAEEPAGDVLCFLPGAGEIARTAGLLADLPAGVELLRLHGQSRREVQDAVLDGAAPGGPRRVVLSTAVAESSLTVPGVRIVVDAGLAREPRVDHARGLGALTTVSVSRAAADQRAGRAARRAPGVVYRCWAQGEETRRPRWPSPEISVADLTGFALRAACWGAPGAQGLALLNAPPAGALAAAQEVLHALGAVDAHGKPTSQGARMVRTGLPPRLARALQDAAPLVGSEATAQAVALLSEGAPQGGSAGARSDDATAVLRSGMRARDAYGERLRVEVRRLRGVLSAAEDEAAEATADAHGTSGSGNRPRQSSGSGHDTVGDGELTEAVGVVAALAYPERVARAAGDGGFLMASGTRAQLDEASSLRAEEWLAIAAADRPLGRAAARVRLAAPIDRTTAELAAAPLRFTRTEVCWEDGAGRAELAGEVVARRVEGLGAVVLAEQPLDEPDPAAVAEALQEGLQRHGTRLLRWTEAAVSLRRRIAFLHRELGAPWPDVSEQALLARAPEWLGNARSAAELARLDIGRLLGGLLPWASGEAARLDEWAPERIEVPSGSRIRIDYAPERPVLAVKLQELFGLQETPRLADGRAPLLLHLLSPAGRPAAVTDDLASFWAEGYRSVRAELRGRYPKHPWPEDPSTAEATRHTTSRRRGGS